MATPPRPSSRAARAVLTALRAVGAGLTAGAALLLVSGTGQAQTPPPGPAPERIEIAVERLETAWKDAELEDLLDVLREESRIVAPEVVRQIKRGLTDRRTEVRDMAIALLGTTEHVDALEALRSYVKRSRRTIEDDYELHERVIRAVGLHGDAGDLDWFAHNLFAKSYDSQHPEERRIVKARIYALGQIRTNDSLERIFHLMRSSDAKKMQRNMRDMRVSLMLLTGKDLGTDMQAWGQWWNKNKKSFEVAPEVPVLPESERRSWESFWGYGRTYDRGRGRSERGKD